MHQDVKYDFTADMTRIDAVILSSAPAILGHERHRRHRWRGLGLGLGCGRQCRRQTK